MPGKYDAYWRSKLNEIRSLLDKAYRHGTSGTLDVSDIQPYGDRKDWHGVVEVSKDGFQRGEMAHARSLGRVILDEGLLEGYGEAGFRLVITRGLKLKAQRLNMREKAAVTQVPPINVEANLVGEFQRIRDNHERALQKAAARAVLGSSVIRVFASGTKKHLLPVLAAVPVDKLVELNDASEFKSWFEGQLEIVAQEIKQRNPNNSRIYPGYKWGHAAKVLNLYLWEVVLGSRYFTDSEMSRIRPWLYVPIDGLVIRRLRQMGLRLPFAKIKEIDSPEDFYFVQDLLGEAAAQVGVPRIWFDDIWGDRQ